MNIYGTHSCHRNVCVGGNWETTEVENKECYLACYFCQFYLLIFDLIQACPLSLPFPVVLAYTVVPLLTGNLDCE